MSRIRQRDTALELLLRRALFRAGLRYRVNYRKLPGSPDIVFLKARVAVFVDGDFWHGWRYDEKAVRYSDYWRQKIADNMARDKRVDAELTQLGWRVIRVWEHRLKKDIEGVCAEVLTALGKEGRS